MLDAENPDPDHDWLTVSRRGAASLGLGYAADRSTTQREAL